MFYGGPSPFYACVVGGGAGGDFVYLQKYFCTPRNIFGGAENEGAGDVWNFQCAPSLLLFTMVACIVTPDDTHAITILETYGLYIVCII